MCACIASSLYFSCHVHGFVSCSGSQLSSCAYSANQFIFVLSRAYQLRPLSNLLIIIKLSCLWYTGWSKIGPPFLCVLTLPNINRFSTLFDCQNQEKIVTSLPKVIWEQGRVAAAVPGAGGHKGLRMRNVCIVFVKDRCVRKRAVF